MQFRIPSASETKQRGGGADQSKREGWRSRLEVRPELVDPAEAAGLAGARQEAFGSNGAPLPGSMLPDVPQQHLVLLRRPRPLPRRRLLAAATTATARLHRPRPPLPPATTTIPVGDLSRSPRRAHSSLSRSLPRSNEHTKAQCRWPRTPVIRQYRSSGRKRCCRVGPVASADASRWIEIGGSLRT